MNADRRHRLEALRAEVNDLLSKLEAIQEEEQGAFDNMPESLQSSERGEKAQAALDAIDSAVSSLNDAETSLQEAAE